MTAGRILATMALLTAASAAQAQSATQNVTFQVDAINEIAFTGTPSLAIITATAGSAPTAVQASGSWAVTTNGSNMKVTAAINSAMPAGLTLTANLAAPTGGSSAGATSLSTTAADVVTGISAKAESGLNVTYELNATLAAGVVASQSRTVTYTITTGTWPDSNIQDARWRLAVKSRQAASEKRGGSNAGPPATEDDPMMSFDAYPNHVAGSFMIAVTSTDNPVPSQSGSSEEGASPEPAPAEHEAAVEQDGQNASNDTPESSS